MNQILKTRTSVSPMHARILNAISTLSAGLALLSLAQCAAATADDETGAVGQALAVGHGDDGPTCGAHDGCKPDCAIPDWDCTSSEDDEDTQSKPSVTWSLTGSVFRTDVSGYPGSEYTMGNPDSDDSGVYAILSNERSNEPCYVSIGTEDLNNAKSDFTSTLDECGPNSYNESSRFLHADYLDVDAGGDDDHIFVNGVIVCMNSDYTKVKGIGVTGVKLTADGTLVSLLGSQADTRPNCDGRWASWQYCLAGQIATAVDFHFGAGKSPRDLTGIGLECKKVTH